MRWLGLDIETTGLDIKNDRIIEIGAVLWDTERCFPLSMFSVLIKHEGVIVPEFITDLTGIKVEDVVEFGVLMIEATNRLVRMAKTADAFVAHNGLAFDKPFLVNEINATGATDVGKLFQDKHWIDTKTDLPYGKKIKQSSLSLLAAQHEFLNPFAHRAQFDVLTMLKIASKYDEKQIMELSHSPMLELIADVDFKTNHLARENGFYWDRDKKSWKRNIKEMQLKDLKLPFAFKSQAVGLL